MGVSSKNIESSKFSGINLKDRRCHLDDGHFNEKIYSLKNRHAYVGKITEHINKLTKYMNLVNKSTLQSVAKYYANFKKCV